MKKKKEQYKSNDVTFVNSKNVPFQRWYPYIQGYSPDFVKTIICENLENPGLIYEPFAGTGTTLFASDALGINTIYSEVNPLLRYLISTKLEVLSLSCDKRIILASQLKQLAGTIMQDVLKEQSNKQLEGAYNEVFGKSIYFPESQYLLILKLRSYIDCVEKQNSLLSKLLTVATFSLATALT